MRTFCVTYSVPGTCDCCGAALPVEPSGASAGTYKVELPEGATPTAVQIGSAAEVVLGAGRLTVKLRQKRGVNREWAVKPLYNSDAFKGERRQTEYRDQHPDFFWNVFSFELPEYKPSFSTWWAELTMVEVPWGSRALGGQLAVAHNAATLSIRLTGLE